MQLNFRNNSCALGETGYCVGAKQQLWQSGVPQRNGLLRYGCQRKQLLSGGASRDPGSPTVLPMDSSGGQRRPVAKHRCRVTDADRALSAGRRKGSRRDEPAAGAHNPVLNSRLLPRRSGVEAKHRAEGFPNCHLVRLRSSPECDGLKDASFLQLRGQ